MNYATQFEAIRDKCLDAGDGCWVWGGAVSNGVPAAKLGGRVVGVRRWIAGQLGRRVTRSVVVWSRCDDPLCVAPGHLRITDRAALARHVIETRGNYNADLVRRHRVSEAMRARSPYSQALADRVRELQGEYSQREIAARLGVPQRWVNRVLAGKVWAPLDNPFRQLIGVVRT